MEDQLVRAVGNQADNQDARLILFCMCVCLEIRVVSELIRICDLEVINVVDGGKDGGREYRKAMYVNAGRTRPEKHETDARERSNVRWMRYVVSCASHPRESGDTPGGFPQNQSGKSQMKSF